MNPQHLHDMPDTGAALAGLNEAHASGLFNADSNSIAGLFVFEMNDCDWVVARSKDEALHYYDRIFVPEDSESVKELSGEQLDGLSYFIEDSGGAVVSFRQRLQEIVDNGEEVPDLFASTEF
ncbi:hypothetical protein B0T40_10445 [Chromobacterium haemolyticum]|uniref:hypothetical protein n=1 Tax=Chromobacterium haemolyticum TaxID=394935 RepID=UPI0009D9EDEE|nr:hypothetical protein [Chromobacterium haemolyticum]OQS36797.1 hypothetical protein B0T40_10445 [Chromobacterium haemolyticum]